VTTVKARANKLAIGLTALAALGVAAVVAIACSDDPHRRTSAAEALGGGGACAAMAGQLPAPNCDNSDNKCVDRPGCVIDEAKCGSKSTCLPIGDNKGKDLQNFRIRRLNIATPEALAGPLIQDTVVTLNISLAAKECAEQGKGLFTWLLQVDRKNNTLTTGGAPPPDDPFGQGFCFARFDLGPTKIAPITTKVVFDGDTFHSTEPQKLGIPIFIDQRIESVIVLPITDVQVQGVSISDDGQCIGHLNPLALDPQCMDDSLCAKWQTAGALGGYITLEEADAVKIAILNNKSLCAFLSGEIESCARDPGGKISFKGDFCSKDKTPGSCADSVWLAATFAASAAKIFDGQGTVPGCSGIATGTDGGNEGGTDAGSDADAADAADADGG
jgi:hypothetical protein